MVVDSSDTGAMSQAVAAAASLAHPGDVVPLAPGCASRDMFTDYGERVTCSPRQSRNPSEPARPAQGVARWRSSLPAIAGCHLERRPHQDEPVKQALNRPLADYYLLLVSAALLIGIGIMMVLSSSSVYAYAITGDAYYFVKRQVVSMLAGVLGAWPLARRSPKALRVLGWLGLGLAVAMLLATFIPGLGYDAGKGNRNWLQLGTPWLRLQPSEFAKLAMAL